MINFKKGIPSTSSGQVSTPLAIAIIVVFVILIGGGILGYQYYWLPKQEQEAEEETKLPETETPKDETAYWEIFVDKEAGYSFKYPNYVTVLPTDLSKNQGLLSIIISEVMAAGLPEDAEDLVLFVVKEKISSNSNSRSPIGYGDAFAVKDSKKEIKIGKTDKTGNISMILAMFEVCDVQFKRRLIFSHNGYNIQLDLESVGNKIRPEMPQYFTIDRENCGNLKIWDFNNNATNRFYNDLANRKGYGEAQLWYDTFDKIVSTIDFFDVSPPEDETVGWKTYRNEEYGFEIKYPKDFIIDENYSYDLSGGLSTSGSMVLPGVSFNLPTSYTTGTNLNPDTKISVEFNAKVVDKCTADNFFRQGPNPVILSQETINNITFSKGFTADVAAGNSYSTTVYSTFGQPFGRPLCFGIRLFVRSGSMDVYYGTGIKAYDSEKLESIFNEMVSSFKIID